MKPIRLRCEYQSNPLGLDEKIPRLSWKLVAKEREREQTAYQILVSSSYDILQQNEGDLWNSGKVASRQSVHIAYEGIELNSRMKCWWKVRIWDEKGVVSAYSDPAWWEMGLLDTSDWQAKWIGLDNHFIPACAQNDDVGQPSPYLRKMLTVDKEIESARIYASALGLYELYINGERVGSACFTPGWTDYHQRIEYQSYDVTKMLKTGKNMLGSILGDGWYTGHVAHVGRGQYGDYPLGFILQLELSYTDGTFEVLATDTTWEGTTGPILFSDIQMGETYDARKEIPGWNNPVSTASMPWHSMHVLTDSDAFAAKLTPQKGPDINIVQEISPKAITSPGQDTHIFDMGQNMVGQVEISVVGQAGSRVRLRFGEMLNEDGSLYTENLRTARQTDTYILKGDGLEVYRPRFTFHGFRYVEVTGYPGEPSSDSIKGLVIHSDAPFGGEFECSDPMLNQLQRNIVWGQRGNFLSIPTDCPQRNERMGWTGDAQIFIRTAAYNMDVSGFFTKWMVDVADAQEKNGAFSDVAPQVRGMGSGNNAWGDGGVIIPWTMYLCYQDTRIISHHYQAMAGWIAYLKKNSEGLLRPDTGFGDWLNVNEDAPKDVLQTAYFAYSTRLLSKMAAVIGKHQDAQQYEDLFQSIIQAFNDAYVKEDGRIKGDTQTEYVVALHMGLLPMDKRPLAARHLVENINSKGWHLSTGFVGVGYLLPVLTEYGYLDVAYRLIQTDTYPSWLYSIKNGATTIWERWNSYTKESGFGDVKMNSFNHYSLGSVGEWFYRFVAGIEINEQKPGYQHIVIQPHPGGSLQSASGSYDSIYGVIKSRWEIKKDELRLAVSIPANTTASIHFPALGNTSTKGLNEGNKPVAEAVGVRRVYQEQDKIVIEVGSGDYQFTKSI